MIEGEKKKTNIKEEALVDTIIDHVETPCGVFRIDQR